MNMLDWFAIWLVNTRIAIDTDVHDLIPIEVETIDLALVTNALHIRI